MGYSSFVVAVIIGEHTSWQTKNPSNQPVLMTANNKAKSIQTDKLRIIRIGPEPGPRLMD